MYLAMGVGFTYLGFIYATETILNPPTIIFLLFATFDFYIASRIIKTFLTRKKE